MQNESRRCWDPNTLTALRGGNYRHNFIPSYRPLYDEATSTSTSKPPTEISSLLPSTVYSSCSSSLTFNTTTTATSTGNGFAGNDFTKKDAGEIFQEKIRLLKKSMQEQRAARDQQHRERDICEPLERMQRNVYSAIETTSPVNGNIRRSTGRDAASQTQPVSLFPVFSRNSSVDTGCYTVIDGDKDTTIRNTATPLRGSSGMNVDKGETYPMDLSSSPAVVVVIDESPDPKEIRESTTMSRKDNNDDDTSTSATSFLSPVDVHSRRAVTAAHGDGDVVHKEAGQTDTVCVEKLQKSQPNKSNVHSGRMTVKESETSLSSTIHSSQRHYQHNQHQTLVSPFIAAGATVGKTNKHQPKRKEVQKIHSLRAPSESSRSRISSRHCTRESSLHSSPPPSDTETKRMLGNSEEEEIEKKRMTARNGGNHGVIRYPSMSAENSHNHKPNQMSFKRSGTAVAAAAEDTSRMGNKLHGHKGTFIPLRSSSSPNMKRTWTKGKEENPMNSTAVYTRSLSNVDKGIQRRPIDENSSETRQRRCLLRQIRLIDAEIDRMEQMPWSKSLRSGSSVSTRTLQKEKSKLIALRRQYNLQLERVAEKEDMKPNGLPPQPQNLSTSTLQSARRSSRLASPSMPRHGPSVYESVLQQQSVKESAQTNRRMMGRPTLLRPTDVNRNSVSRRMNSTERNGLPPRVGIPMRSHSHANCVSSRREERPCVPRGFITRTNSDVSHAANVHSKNGRNGYRRSVSIDAERMAALYARNASSSQSLRRDGTPLRDSMGRFVADRDNSYFASSSASDHGKKKGAPLYCNRARLRRDTQSYNKNNSYSNSNSTREMSGFRSGFTSSSPSPVKMKKPLSTPIHTNAFRGEWREADLCDDVAADQYYCAEYGEEEESRNTVSMKGTAAAVKGRGSSQRGPLMTCVDRQPRARSSTPLEKRQTAFGTSSSARRINSSRSKLCYHLRAPTPQEVSARNKSKRLYFCQDSSMCTSGSGSMHVVPQRLKVTAEVRADARRDDVHKQFVGSNDPQTSSRRMSTSHPLQMQPNQTQEYRPRRSADSHANATVRANSSRSSPPAATGRIAATNGHRCNEYSMNQRDQVDWTSPPRCQLPSRTIVYPHPEAETEEEEELLLSTSLPGTARPSCSRLGQAVGKSESMSISARHYNPNDAMSVCGRLPQRRQQQFDMTARRTPSHDQKRQEQQLIESSSRLSEIHLSPLTEHSPTPTPASVAASAYCYKKSPVMSLPQRSMERQHSLRDVMMADGQSRAYLQRSAFSPSQQERTIFAERQSGNALAATATESFNGLKSHRIFGDDRTNGSSLSSAATSLYPTRRVGSGGTTLRQLFGHEQRPALSPPASRVKAVEDAGNSTEVLLSRIQEMRAQMK